MAQPAINMRIETMAMASVSTKGKCMGVANISYAINTPATPTIQNEYLTIEYVDLSFDDILRLSDMILAPLTLISKLDAIEENRLRP
jgi:hypothetical protein